MTTYQHLMNSRAELLRVMRDHGAERVRVFGSVVRGEDDALSDVDLLITMAEGRDLLDLVAMEQELEELLGRKVDVVTEGSLSPYLRDGILSEAKPL